MREANPKYDGYSPFSSKMVCGVCGWMGEVRLKMLENSPALTTETFGDVRNAIYFFDSTTIYGVLTLCPARCLPVSEETKMHET